MGMGCPTDTRCKRDIAFKVEKKKKKRKVRIDLCLCVCVCVLVQLSPRGPISVDALPIIFM